MYKKIIAGILLVLIVAGVGCWWWLKSFVPAYSGNEKLPGLKQKVEVYFDKFGVPHIYAQSESDAYHALGYIVARDRMFQFEMIRRMAAGRLAEIIGQPMLKSDKFFRTLGLAQHSDQSAAEFERTAPAQLKSTVKAYLDGVNAFIEQGKLPFEFAVIGIEPEKIQLRDIFGFWLCRGFSNRSNARIALPHRWQCLHERTRTRMAQRSQNHSSYRR